MTNVHTNKFLLIGLNIHTNLIGAKEGKKGSLSKVYNLKGWNRLYE